MVPFANLFGLGEDDNDDNEHCRRNRDDDYSPSLDGSIANYSASEGGEMHVKRSAEEVAYVVKAWDTYVHERAKALWKTPARRYSILSCIAKECARSDDPVLGNDVSCVRWNGPMEDNYPVITVTRPGESKGSTTYVNRMLVFLFADQQSYEQIDKEHYRAFEMACGNSWCINLTHISLS